MEELKDCVQSYSNQWMELSAEIMILAGIC
jgi:hypothetical protein